MADAEAVAAFTRACSCRSRCSAVGGRALPAGAPPGYAAGATGAAGGGATAMPMPMPTSPSGGRWRPPGGGAAGPREVRTAAAARRGDTTPAYGDGPPCTRPVWVGDDDSVMSRILAGLRPNPPVPPPTCPRGAAGGTRSGGRDGAASAGARPPTPPRAGRPEPTGPARTAGPAPRAMPLEAAGPTLRLPRAPAVTPNDDEAPLRPPVAAPDHRPDRVAAAAGGAPAGGSGAPGRRAPPMDCDMVVGRAGGRRMPPGPPTVLRSGGNVRCPLMPPPPLPYAGPGGKLLRVAPPPVACRPPRCTATGLLPRCTSRPAAGPRPPTPGRAPGGRELERRAAPGAGGTRCADV